MRLPTIVYISIYIYISNDEYWTKRLQTGLFDVTMGSSDGAETCELVGLFLLNEIRKRHNNNFGLYRDDGLGIINTTARQTENIKIDLSPYSKNITSR